MAFTIFIDQCTLHALGTLAIRDAEGTFRQVEISFIFVPNKINKMKQYCFKILSTFDSKTRWAECETQIDPVR